MTPITPTAAVRTVCPKASARKGRSPSFVADGSDPDVSSRLKIGTNGADSPAPTRMSRAISGIRNAALYASSSALAPNSAAKTRFRTTPAAK